MHLPCEETCIYFSSQRDGFSAALLQQQTRERCPFHSPVRKRRAKTVLGRIADWEVRIHSDSSILTAP